MVKEQSKRKHKTEFLQPAVVLACPCHSPAIDADRHAIRLLALLVSSSSRGLRRARGT